MPLPAALQTWCHAKEVRIWEHHTLSPCLTATLSAPLVLLCALSVLILATVRRKRATGPRRRIWQVEITAADLVLCLTCVALSALHIFWPLYLVWHKLGSPALHVFNGMMAASWMITLASAWSGWRAGAITSPSAVLWAATLAYLLQLWADVSMYVEKWGPARTVLVPWTVVTSSAFTLAAICAIVVTLRRSGGTSTSTDPLKAPLLEGGGDQEAQKPPEKIQRSWTSLVLVSLLYVWPEGTWYQLRAIVCLLLVASLRVLNLLVPLLFKNVVDTFAAASERAHPPPGVKPQHSSFMEVFYPWVLAYMVVSFFQGGSGPGTIGLISNLRSFLWIPISQQAYRRICLDMFSHVLSMDLNFHLHRKTGEITRVMDRGTSSIQSILSLMIFSIGPAIFDILAASVYLATAIQPWVAVIVFVTLVSYIPLTIYLTEWRGQFRRDMNRLDNQKGAKMTDALLNYETVKYFNNEALEQDNFGAAIGEYQSSEFVMLMSLNLLNVVQSFVLFLGIIGGLLVCTKGVANGSLTVGDLVLFITLMQQLYAPLNFFGSYYRSIQQAMIDMENMFDLLMLQPRIQDAPDAATLPSPTPGDPSTALGVAFERVSFAYTPGSLILKDVSFSVAGGKSLGLVGATGSGKSTVLRLLFRFYEPTAGVVRVGGMALTGLRQESLRRNIGVVPQDTVLFNDTIMYNIRYGRPEATDEEVHRAAEMAALHEAITGRFPLGYNTVVGERGLRLSGGEKQRVAFARAILKNPAILVLDEATSALDSLTERRIQSALEGLRHERTTLIVAHRLSTIMSADGIVVLKEGSVAEQGAHPELLAAGGLYAEMWTRQQERAPVNGTDSSSSLAGSSSIGELASPEAAGASGSKPAATGVGGGVVKRGAARGGSLWGSLSRASNASTGSHHGSHH